MRSLAFVVALPCVACFTPYGLGGQIRSAACGDAPEAALAGVHVTAQCPAGAPRIEAITDARGTFHVLEKKYLDARCEVILEKPGYVTRRFSASELCDHVAATGEGVDCGIATAMVLEASR